MIIIHIHNAVGGAVKSTVEIRIDVAGEVEVERLTPAEIAEQEVEGPGELVDHAGADNEAEMIMNVAIGAVESGFDLGGVWPEPAKAEPNSWKDKQGL